MIRGVPRRVHGLEDEFVGLQGVAIVEDAVRAERSVLLTTLRRRPAQQFGARRIGQRFGARRMIGVRVRHEHPANPRACPLDDVVDVPGDGRTRVEDAVAVLERAVNGPGASASAFSNLPPYLAMVGRVP